MHITVKQIFLFTTFALFAACNSSVKEVSMQASLIKVDSINAPNNEPMIEEILSPFREHLKLEMNETLAFSPIALENGTSESPLGNYLADILFQWGTEQSQYPLAPDFSLLNAGGIRSPLPKGHITLFNVYQTMPFDNCVAFVSLNRNNIAQMLEYITTKNNVNLGNGIIKQNKGDYILETNKEHNNPSYVIITSDYLARGGDHMDFLTQGEVTITNVLLRDIIVNHLKKSKTIKPLELKKRINLN